MSMLYGREDVVTGLVSNVRPEEQDGDKILGLFLNTLPFRQTLCSGSWTALIRAAFESELRLIPHRFYPFTQMFIDNHRLPIFESVFNYVHFHVYDKLRDAEGIEILDSFGFERTNFALVTHAVNQADSLRLTLAFDPRRLSASQVNDIAGYYLSIMIAMSERPDANHKARCYLSEREHQLILDEWNDTAEEYPREKCIQELFEEQVERSPEAIAVEYEEEQLSYEELAGERISWGITYGH